MGCGFWFLLTALVVVSSPPPFPLPPLVLLFPPPHTRVLCVATASDGRALPPLGSASGLPPG